MLAFGQGIAIDYIEVCAVFVELYLGQHKIEPHLVVELLHTEIHSKTILLAVCHGLYGGRVAYLSLLGGVFFAKERNLYSTTEARTAETVLLYVQVDIVESNLPATNLGRAIRKEAVHRNVHRETRCVVDYVLHTNLHARIAHGIELHKVWQLTAEFLEVEALPLVVCLFVLCWVARQTEFAIEFVIIGELYTCGGSSL